MTKTVHRSPTGNWAQTQAYKQRCAEERAKRKVVRTRADVRKAVGELPRKLTRNAARLTMREVFKIAARSVRAT